jgi:hypothetical protein
LSEPPSRLQREYARGYFGDVTKRLLFTLLLSAFASACAVAPKEREDGDPYCGMLPEAVIRSAIYSGWSSCSLKRLGEPALHNGLPDAARQITRFTFTEGHGKVFRTVTITEHLNGTGVLRVQGTRRRGDYRDAASYIVPRRVRLSVEDVARIDRLGAEAGAWDYAVGTWDEKEEIYMHCQLLEMERASEAGYRFSSVNIGCNQPQKLMPLVNEIVRLAGMRQTHPQLFE